MAGCHPQSVGIGLISGRRDASTCNSLGMEAHARLAHLLLSEGLEGIEQRRSEFSSSGVAVPAWGRGTVTRRASHDHSGGDSRDSSLWRGLQWLVCCCHVFSPLRGTNYPHPSNISSHFHKQLTSVLHHQASEKGVVTQLLKDGRTGCLAYIIKGGLAFQLEFLNRGRISENFTKQKYFTLFWEGFVL